MKSSWGNFQSTGYYNSKAGIIIITYHYFEWNWIIFVILNLFKRD